MDAQGLRISLLHCVPVPAMASGYTLTSVLLDPPVTNTSHFRDGEADEHKVTHVEEGQHRT